MSTASTLAGASLISLAVFHSYLGERFLIGPLLASAEFPRLPVGQDFAQRTLRMAWHLTSLAWLTLAYLTVSGQCAPLPVAVLLAVSGLVAYAATSGRHFAWAVFLVGALAAATEGWQTQLWTRGAALLGALLFAVVGALHVAWAAGVRTGVGAAVPELRGKPLFEPGKVLTLLVGLSLLVAAWLVLALGHWLPAPLPAPVMWAAGALAAAVFGLRTLGDGRFVGLFKRVHGTRFALLDDRVFTPVSFALCAAIVLQLI
ncbi:MAG TPA: DUF3995 domain-containing protein [Polyangiales bacterium]|nr:DUF3995 domain-containing protein [Polyangiales bacterium]